MCSGSWWTWGSCSERSTLITPEGGVDNDGSHSLIVDECTSEGERLSTSEDGVYALINGVENSRVEAISKKFMVSPRSCSQNYEVDDITFVFAQSYLHRVNPGRSIQFGVHNIVSNKHQETLPIKPTGKADYQESVVYNERVSIGKSRPNNNGGDYCEHTCIEFSIWENVLGTDNECVLWSGSIRGARAFFTEGQGTRFKIPEACSGMIKPVANVCPPESDMEMSGFSSGSSWNGDYFPRKFTSGDQKGQTYWESRTHYKYLYHKQVTASDYWCLGSSLTNCEYFAYNADPANPSTSNLSWILYGTWGNTDYANASVGCKMSVVSLESWLLFGYLNGVKPGRNLLVKEEAEETEEIAEVIFEEIVEEIENRQLPEETCDNIYMDLAVTGGLSEIKIAIPYVNRDFKIWEDGDGQIDMNAGQQNLFSPKYITCADLVQTVSCGGGEYSVAGACQNCPVDTFGSGSAARTSCTPCPDSKNAPPGSNEASDCSYSTVSCGAGYYSINGECQRCPANTFGSGAAARTSCTPCPHSKNAPPGSDEASDCSYSTVSCGAGYYSINGACESCPANTFGSGTAERTSCTPCPDSKTAPVGSNEALDCTAPSSSSDVFSLVATSSSSTSKCAVSGQCFSSVDYSANENCEFTLSAGLSGQLVFSSFAVEENSNCAYDYLEIGGTKYCTGRQPPTPLPISGGSVVRWKTDESEQQTGFSACLETVGSCYAGYYSLHGACQRCPPNTYGSGAAARTSCTPCPDSKNAPAGSEEASDCTFSTVSCEAGYYSINGACESCPANTFSR